MGQTSAGLTLPVRTHAGAWDDCYDEPCQHKECNRHLWTRLYGLHTISVMPWTQGMTMQHKTKLHCTAREVVT